MKYLLDCIGKWFTLIYELWFRPEFPSKHRKIVGITLITAFVMASILAGYQSPFALTALGITATLLVILTFMLIVQDVLQALGTCAEYTPTYSPEKTFSLSFF